jgi:chlorophyll a/b binding light-harvesting protein PcbD
LASIGIGFDEAGVWTGVGVASIAIVHLVFSMVYGAGGLLHAVLFEEDVQNSSVIQAKKFKLDWKDPDNQTFILGHHLIFMGVACVWFVEWARIHGIYDPAIGAIRQVNYNLDLSMIWQRQFDFLSIDSLEDVMGGHAFLAFAEITGGAFHIIAGSTPWADKRLGEYTKFKGAELLSAEAVLSWSLAGIGWMAIVAAFWCATNTTVYPEAWYGEPLQLKFAVSPYWIDTGDLSDSTAFWGHSTRAALSNVHYYLGFFFLQGHFWHALRALGFDFKKVPSAIGNDSSATITINS